MYQAAAEDPEMRRALMQACAEDINFWVKGFCWTYDPRKTHGGTQPKLPFIPYGFQIESFREIDEILGKEDLLIEKSRDMGASWILLTTFAWRWLFHPMQSFLLVSRKEDLVDKSGDPKSLFWKIDFLLKYIPTWMRPALERRKLHLYNKENGSTIDGESTTGDVARGDRRTAIGLDEFASVDNGPEVLAATGDATDCRVFNSTPKGTGNAFYTQREKGTRRLTLHWSRHPEKALGLYSSNGGKLIRLDEEYEYPPDYAFILDGRLRSPWYDRECSRRSHQVEVAQELDIDYLGSAYQFFDSDTLRKLKEENASDPKSQGFFDYDPHTHEILSYTPSPKGHFRSWIDSPDGSMPGGYEGRKYVIGCDVSSGTGATESAATIVDKTTGVKVAEYVNQRITPESFAHVVVALAKHFNNASLIWEANGPGRPFGQTILETGYRNIYLRRDDAKIVKKVSDVPGWFSTKETKRTLLGAYRDGLVSRKIIVHSAESYDQAAEYVYLPNDSIEHSRANNSTDPSSSKDNHGDRVIADALAYKLLKDTTREEKAKNPIILPGSLAWRRQLQRDSERERRITW